MNHEVIILRITRRLRVAIPLAKPTPITEPTMVCVVEMGRPSFENMSTVDAVAQQKFHDYTEYKLKMFERTSTEFAPWVIIDGNDRDTARLEALRYVVSNNNYPDKGATKVRMEVDPNIVTVLKSKEDLDKVR